MNLSKWRVIILIILSCGALTGSEGEDREESVVTAAAKEEGVLDDNINAKKNTNPMKR